MMGWYVINVETGFEDEVCYIVNHIKPYLLEHIEYNLLVPKRILYERKRGIRNKVVRKLFPGYILVETNRIEQFYFRINRLPHIIKFLRNNDYFLEVENDEIKHIFNLINKEGLIDISQGFMINDKVKIIDGPLLNYEGIIKKIDKRKGRAKVEFTIHNNPLLIDLGIDIIQITET